MRTLIVILAGFFIVSCSSSEKPGYEIVIKNGIIYDGTGGKPYPGDIAIEGDKIVEVGQLDDYNADTVIDVQGMAISPGFVNMLSWAGQPLLKDGRSMSDIKQGVTLEVFGEGSSLGPLSATMKENVPNAEWNSFGEAMEYLEGQGVTPNVASFVGATTIRVHELGYENRAPNDEELRRMLSLVRESMKEGALGVGSSLIYAPAFFASTEELTEMARVAAEYHGMYISHLRSEGDAFEEAVDEFLSIAKNANIDAEIYHLKAAGKKNWDKLDEVLTKIKAANEAGMHISADMYNYTAASTGLDATMPPWVQEGGTTAWIKRLKDPAIRAKVFREMQQSSKDWENFFIAAGDPKNILLVEFQQDSLQYLTGKTVAEISAMRGTAPAETIIDLVIQNGGDISTVYFLMSEENIKKQLKLPYMSFCSDARSIAAEGDNLNSSTHPRTYGNFARLLGKYVREEQVIPMEEAIHKLTLLSAEKLKISNRGKLAPDYYADIVVFDPDKIDDKATYEKPHQYAVGVEHVWVNGTQVLRFGEHTGKTPGRFLKGPGYTGSKQEAAAIPTL